MLQGLANDGPQVVSGRTIAAQLAQRNLPAVLVGRDAQRLLSVARQTGGTTRESPSVPATAAEIRQERPRIDLANDPDSLAAAFGCHDRAVDAGHTVVTDAGFGVTATESVVVKLCEALTLTLPDGATERTAGVPLGSLLAAHRASGAPYVLSASNEAPSSPVTRTMLSALSTLMRWDWPRSMATRSLARIRVSAKAASREHSWAHAVATWADGESREDWLRLGEAQEFSGGEHLPGQ